MEFQNDGGRGGFGERKMFQGNWNCSKCQAAITELPFQPDDSRLDQLLCRDCHRSRMQNRRGGGGGGGGFGRR
jgi:CxxC-x17-CxxC domain-containing protein